MPLDVTFAEPRKPAFRGKAFMAANAKRKSKTPELYAQRQHKAHQNRIQALQQSQILVSKGETLLEPAQAAQQLEAEDNYGSIYRPSKMGLVPAAEDRATPAFEDAEERPPDGKVVLLLKPPNCFGGGCRLQAEYIMIFQICDVQIEY